MIALTASAFDSQRDKVLEVGADDYVRKPFPQEILLEKLSKIPGVEYVCEETVSMPDVAAGPHIPTHAEVEMLPASLIDSMRDALERGNMAGLRSLIVQVETINPDMAGGLLALVRQYDYDRLSTLLGKEGNRENGK